MTFNPTRLLALAVPSSGTPMVGEPPPIETRISPSLDPSQLLALKVASAGAAKVGEVGVSPPR